MALTDPNADGMSNLDNIGLALSYFGDAANQFRGVNSSYGQQNLQALKALQDQLLRTQQIKKAQAQQTAQAKLTGSYDPSTDITWNQPTAPTGNYQQLEDAPKAGIANTAASSPPPPSSGAPAGIASGPLPNNPPPGIANSTLPADASTPKFTLHSLAEDTPAAAGAIEQIGDSARGNQALLAQAYPDAYGQAMVTQALSPPETVKLGDGEVAYAKDRRTGALKEIGRGGDKQPDKIKEIEAVYGPDWRNNPKAVQDLRQSMMPASTALSVNTQGENQFSKTLNEQWGKEAADVSAAANSARDRITSVQQFMALADKVKTGKLQPTLQEVSGWAQSLGIKPESLGIDPNTATAGQVMDKIQNRLAMQNIGPGGLPANNFSEADRKFVQATTVNKANTPEANRLISQIGIAADRRALQKDRMWTDAYSKGINWPTFKKQWSEYVDSTPLFPKMDSPEQAAQLPPGTLFTDANGQIRVRP